ncbi:MAG: hypothetical protein AAGA86_05420 [Bacteroidota bacterium]
MKRLMGIGASLLFLFLACERKNPQMKEVMAIHDDVMPKMGTIGRLVAELKPKVDSTETGVQYGAAMKDLQAAHQGMMDWMKGFGDRFDPDEILNGKALTDQKKAWLDEEEEKVRLMRDHINTSITNAKRLLGKSE